MSSTAAGSAEFDFLLSCLKNTKEKPNFEEVAKECGLTNKDAAYKRHWAIMKKHGLAGNTGKSRKAAVHADDTPTPSPKKRGRKPKKQSTNEGDGDALDGEEGESETPSKKAKSKSETAVKPEKEDEDENESENENENENGEEVKWEE